MAPEQEAETREALEDARSRDALRRRAGLQRLQQMGGSGLEPLLKLLREQMTARRSVRAVLSVFMWLLLPVSLTLMPGILLSLCLSKGGIVLTTALIVWTLNWLLFVMRSRIPMTSRQREVLEVFAVINDLRAIGPLIDALGVPEHDPSVLRTTLVRLLKLIRASDSSLLSPHHRAILYRQLLVHRPNPTQVEFILAILHALEQVGTPEAIPYVAQLAKRTYPSPAPPDVLEAAWRCLEFLGGRSDERTIRQTLLRASNPNASRPETLLRPAQEQQNSQSETLLRPDLPTNQSSTPENEA